MNKVVLSVLVLASLVLSGCVAYPVVGTHGGVDVVVTPPPIVVVPPRVYYPPPRVYYPPARVYVMPPPHHPPHRHR